MEKSGVGERAPALLTIAAYSRDRITLCENPLTDFSIHENTISIRKRKRPGC